jgi:iron transport multicopper oxidase
MVFAFCRTTFLFFSSLESGLTMRSHLLLLLHAFSSVAKTITHNWNVGWVTACPDEYCRPAIGINGAWPCPILEADVGDTVVVNVYNNLGNETTSIHYHGMTFHRQRQE